jgi:(p)ppGpp synthase/HD superfamily hydrolase
MENQEGNLRVLPPRTAIHGDYAKQKEALRYWLLGARMFMAVRALNFAEKLHQGLRKDNITPEFAHQIWIASFIRTLGANLPDLEVAIAVGLLHDTVEDYDVTHETLTELFGKTVADATWAVSKIRNRVKIPPGQYFADVAANLYAAIAKGVDRTNNKGSMVGVFSRAKQEEQLVETKEFILPMLKIARRRFPEAEQAFENIKQILITRVAMVEAIHHAADTGNI